MPRQLRLSQYLRVDSDGCKRAVSKADVYALRAGVVSDVIGIVTKSNRLRHPVVITDKLDAFPPAVRHCNQLRIGYHRNPLRLAKSRHAPQMHCSLDVNDLDRVVAQSRDEQTLTDRVERQMVDSSFDSRKFDGGDQSERFLRRRRRHGEDSTRNRA